MAVALRIFAITAAIICFPAFASAATLQAKVVEVTSGNTLVVSNINRSISVRLKAVVPPAAGQPFSEAAREHLKALVLDKIVAVDFARLADGYLEAKVFLNGVDIGLQMLRDGVAWYDRVADHELSDADRDLYARCEQAARSEKRGLWQDQSPVAPWEFRRIQLAKLESASGSQSLRKSTASKARTSSGLSNDDLLGGLVGPSSVGGSPNVKPISANGSPDRWTRFDSPAEHYSVLVPSNAVEGSYSSSDPAGRPVAFHFVAAGNDRAFYALLSAKGPNDNRTDASASDEVIQSLIGGWNQAIVRSGSNALISIKPVRELSMTGYSGKQYSLSSQDFSGTVRVLTKRLDDERQLFVLFTLTRPGSESFANQFLNSFRISQ